MTTSSKAKLAQGFVEKAITDARKGRLHLQRRWASQLTNDAFSRLINEIAPGFSTRYSGYTRIIKLGNRKGDAAPTAKLELLSLDKPEASKKPEAKQKSPKTRKITKKEINKKQDVKKTKK